MNTNKIDLIKAEVERLQSELIQEKEKGFGSDTDDACILELQNVLTYIDSLQEEPVSIDFEQELYKAFGQVKDFTLGMRIAKWFYDMGRKHQEPVSEDLEDFALQYAGHHAPYDSCMQEVKDAVKAGAKWQNNKMMDDAVDGVVAASAGGDGWVNVMTGFVKSKDVNVKFGDKIKIIIVKED